MNLIDIPVVWAEPPHKRAARVREACAAEAALNAPFVALAREEFQSKHGKAPKHEPCPPAAANAAAGGQGAGLVYLKNKFNATPSPCPGTEKGREPVQINQEARRISKMIRRVDHGCRLSEFDTSGEAARYRRLMVTLTYTGVDDWDRAHITRFINAVRQWAKRRRFKLRYVWVAELQERGAVHYHVALWIPSRFLFPHPDSQGWWPHGWSNVTPIKRGGADGVCRYLAKYISKMGEKEALNFPRGARINGDGGFDKEARRHIRYFQSPYWVRDALSGRADIRRTTGGWVDVLTGNFIPSPWKVVVDNAGRVFAVRAGAVPANSGAIAA